MDENYEFEIIEKFGQYISSYDKTKLSPENLVKNSKNVYKDTNGNFVNRPGLKAYGPLDDTLAGVKSAFVWQSSLGLTFPLRVANGKLQVFSSISGSLTYYDLMTDATILSRYVFAPYYNTVLGKDLIVMIRGDSNLYSWSGGMGLLGSASNSIPWVTGVSVASGGPGSGSYHVGQILTVLGGHNDLQVQVTAINGSFAITDVSIYQYGSGYTTADGPYATTLISVGNGTGCTINITSFENNSITLSGSKTVAELGYDTSGNLVINGTTYGYGLISGNTFISVDSNPSLEPVNSVIIQPVITTSNTPDPNFTNDFIRVLQTQLFVGSYTSNKIWISADGTTVGGDFTHFTNSNDLVPGDADFAILDSPPTGMIARSGSMYISGGISDWYQVTPNTPLPVSLATGVGSNRQYVITEVVKLPGTGLSGALAHEFITIVGNNIVYISQDNQLRTIGSFRNIFDTKFPVLSQLVREDLLNENFTGGHIFASGDFIYITAPLNSRHWMFQTRESISEEGNITAERIWHPPQISGISRFEVINGILYGNSNINPMLYQIWDTEQWYDDAPDGSQLPYECVAAFAYMHLSNKGGKSYRRQGKIDFDKIYIEGYIGTGTPLYGKVYFDYQGSTDIQMFFINSPATPGIPVQPLPVKNVKTYTYLDAPSLAQDILADNPIGTGLAISPNAQDYLPKFRAIRKVKPTDSYEFAIEIFSYDIGARFEISAYGPNMKLSDRIARELL